MRLWDAIVTRHGGAIRGEIERTEVRERERRLRRCDSGTATLKGGDLTNETGRRKSKGTGVQALEGKAENMIPGLRMREVAAVIVVVAFSMQCTALVHSRLLTFHLIFRFPWPCITNK